MITQTLGRNAGLCLTPLVFGLIAMGTAAHAQTEEPDHVLLLGVGVYALSNPYESATEDAQGGVLPVFFYENRLLSADLSGLSLKAFDNGRFSLEARVSPRFQLVEPSETRDFASLERNVGVDVGARLSGVAGPWTLAVEYLADVSGETDGQEVNADLSIAFDPDERLSVEVAAGVSWKDEALSTWLYGLTEAEVGVTRAYEFGRSPSAPSGGVFVPSAGVQMRYQCDERIFVIASAEVERFNSDITNSPLMAKGWAAFGSVSLVRQF